MQRRRLAVATVAAAGSLALPLGVRAAAAGGSGRRNGHHRSADAGRAYGRRPDVLQAAQDFAQQLGLDLGWIEATLAQARHVAAVAQLIMPPATASAKNWAAYRARFVETRRVDAGAQWWRDNASWLDSAQERFGVPAEIVVGIVGVETFYGRITGGFRVLDALATLTFDFPRGRSDRSPFFRSELAEFLRLAQREGWDPQALKGSFAGAIGLPQFMPSSITNYAIDFDDDGRIDLLTSSADVAGSVAHFLAEHGWRRAMPTHYDVQPPDDIVERATLLVPDIVPSFTPAQMAARGARLDDAAQQHEGALALIELRNADDPPSYVAGTQNFYALTRYNASSYYAMAVIELGRAVAAAR
ncbi:MAG: lytic murein transglycosylase B [Ideonella sp.]|nr:lytic murein transglycosylase B [Ideonella sp.]MCC7459405.1 lytic murein transglycosylase B [Nitrospira sp.]